MGGEGEWRGKSRPSAISEKLAYMLAEILSVAATVLIPNHNSNQPTLTLNHAFMYGTISPKNPN